MKQSKQRQFEQDARYRRFVFACSTATSCAALLLSAGAARAEDAPAATADQSEQLSEVVVTGIRAAIESAINVKKNSDTIVEAISAEDIGKLPDTTIAESLARLPGVTTQRDRNGNATNVSIRGLGPDFNGYLLNGREQTSTGDSRAVDLSVYPAELIGGATVYKTGDAALMTAGLAGTIDNQLIDPLKYPDMIIAATGERDETSVGIPGVDKGKGKRYSLSYIDQFADRKLGIAIGFVHSDSNSSSLANGSWGSTVDVTDSTGADLGSFSVPFGGGLQFESDHLDDKRNGGAVILNFKPNEMFSSELDGYYAKIDTNLKKVYLKAGSNGGAITDGTVSGTTVTSGTFQLAPDGLIVESESLLDDDTIKSVGWKNSLNFSDAWSGSLDLNHNSAERIEKDIEVYGGITTADTLSFTNGGSTIPTFVLGNPTAYTDPSTIMIRDQSGWSGVTYQAGDLPPGDPNVGRTVPQAGYNKGPTITDKLDAVRVDLKHTLGAAVFSDLQFGANFTKRSKDRITDEGVIASTGDDGYDRIPYPSGSYVETDVGGTGINVLTFDPQAGLWPGATVIRKYNDDILSKTWTVDEKITTGYAKLNINTNAGSLPIRGNVGVQVVHTDQSSGGYRADVSSSVTLQNPASTLSTAGTTYNDFLPSVNLVADLGSGQLLRFGAGIQIARPTLTDMRNSFAAAEDQNSGDSNFGIIVGSSGNPNLKPFKADALDFSYEKYFESKAYLAGAVFYKKLDTYITQSTNVAYDFTTYATNLGIALPASGSYIGQYTTTVNGSGGNVKGIELSASLPFDLFTHYLYGFGLTTSYSNTLSSVHLPNLIGLNPSQPVPTTGGTISLPGLSHINEKVVFYYERFGFSAFVADNRRSQYVGSVSNTTVGGYPSLINIAPQTWVSAQIGYEFQSGFAKGLGLRLEGNNINKPIYKEYKADGSLNFSNQTGATYILRLNYKYE